MPTGAEAKKAVSPEARPRRCSIMQPTYLPWAGYFALIASVDIFVLLDDVQFERRSWQSRNRILLNGREHLLTVPVRKTTRETPICDIELHKELDWRSQHLRVLHHAYGRHPYGRAVLDIVEAAFAKPHDRLAELNHDLIGRLAALLGLQTPITCASGLGCGGQRSDHLAAICRAVDCLSYLSPAGSRDYMSEDGFEERHGIVASFQNFQPAAYEQIGTSDFISHLSIVDVIANKGVDFARAYIGLEASS